MTIFRRILALSCVALCVLEPVVGQECLGFVSFESQQQWLVIANGVVSSAHGSASAAQTAAVLQKQALPTEYVAITQQTMQVATCSVSPMQSPSAPIKVTSAPVQAPTRAPTLALTPVPAPIPEFNGNLVWGYDTTPLSTTLTKPDLYQSYIDPAYNTLVTRVSSAAGTRFNRNTYSRRQPENSDGTMFFTYHGTAAYYVYTRSTGALVRSLEIHPDAEPQWHPTNPYLIRFIEGPNSYVGDLLLYEVDVRTGQSTAIADLSSRLKAVFPDADYMKDRAEGSPSADGARYAWIVYDTTETIVGLVSYDLSTNTVLGTLSVDQFPVGAGSPDWASISPSGQYAMTSHSGGTFVFNADFSNARLVHKGSEHSDMAIGSNGNDVYCFINFDNGWFEVVDLVTLQVSQIFDIYARGANTSIHISGKGYNKPGWVIASTYSCKGDGTAWSCYKVMAVELAPLGRILNLAHTYNCGDGYWTETQAAVNHDFTRAYFNSDAFSCGIDAEVYIVDVPDFS